MTYWYGRHGASLVKTDELKIGDAAAEASHHYVSPQASEPYEIHLPLRVGAGYDFDRRKDKPLAEPADYAEFEFEAPANKTYNIWLRGTNLDGKNSSDASWLQIRQRYRDNPYGREKLHP